MLTAAVIAYAAAMTLANLLVSSFGRAVVPYNAFFLIGFDLAMRDWLHVRLRPWQMGALIVASGALTYLLSPSAAQIAVASAVAFAVAALADWAVFAVARGSWQTRANLSNVAGAAADSLVFPYLAGFGLGVSLGMFAAKVAGGAVWAYVLRKRALA
jgi:uncharacterized PurR-regulated membrane protein YhhQ (DUF165 family)